MIAPVTTRKPGSGRTLRHWLPLLATGALVAALLATVDPRGVLFTIAAVPWSTLAVLLAVSFLFNGVFYALRWRCALRFVGIEHRLGEILRIHLGAGAVRLLLPMQAGDLLSAALLARQRPGRGFVYAGTLLYNKYLNLVATLALGAVGWALTASRTDAVTIRTLLVGTAILGLGLLPEIGALRSLLVSTAARIRPAVRFMLDDLLSVYGGIALRGKLVLLGLSLVFQLSEVVVCLVLFDAFGIDVGFREALRVVPILILVASLPVSLSGVGVRESAALFVLRGEGSDQQILAFGFAYSFVEYLFPLLVGIPWLPGVLAAGAGANREARPLVREP